MGVSTAYHLARRRAGRHRGPGARRRLLRLDGAGQRRHPAPVRQPHRDRADPARHRDLRALRGRVRRRPALPPARLSDPRRRRRPSRRRPSATWRFSGASAWTCDCCHPTRRAGAFPTWPPTICRGATYSPRDGYADPYLATTAIAARARDLGVTIRTGCEVTRRSRARPIGSTASSRAAGVVDAPVVVIATGAWSGVRRPAGRGRHAGAPAAAVEVHHRAVSRSSASRRPRRSSSTRTWGSRCGARAPGSCSASAGATEAASFSTELDWSLSRAAGGARRPPRAGAGRRPAHARRGRASTR